MHLCILSILSILSISVVIGIIVTYDFDVSFAFHKPGSGSTVIFDKEGIAHVYNSNGTDNTLLDSLGFIVPSNETINFAKPTVPQPMNGTT